MSDFDAYQQWTRTTAIYPQTGSGSMIARLYVVLGLANEAGEVAGKVKKWLRDGLTESEITELVADELGDVAWYAARTADEFGLSLGNVAEGNQRKLIDRKARDVIGGSGDKR